MELTKIIDAAVSLLAKIVKWHGRALHRRKRIHDIENDELVGLRNTREGVMTVELRGWHNDGEA
jgi:hypothetical protein